MKLDGKVAVISGGSSGIGLAIAKQLKKENVKIYDISRSGNAKNVFEKSFKCDISSDAQLTKTIEEIIVIEEKIDLLFCNAGIGLGGLFENAEISEIERIMNVNLVSQMKMTKLFLPHIKEGGKIVFTGSIGGIIPLPYQACYSASKAGIENFARALASEVKPRKISVTTVLPFDTCTNFTDARIKHPTGDKAEARGIMKMERSERKGKPPEFVAKRVVKVVRRKHPPLRVSVGGISKLLAFLVKIFPNSLVDFLVRKIYV